MADVITRLRLETEEFHNRARRVTTDVQDMSHQLEVVGNRLVTTDPKMLKLSASFGKMQTVSTTLKGKISELESEFVAWSHLYNQLTDQQKREPFGQNIVRGLDEVRTRIQQTRTELQSIEGSLSGAKGAGFGARFMQGLVPGLGMGAGAAGAMMAVQVAQKAMRELKEQVVDTVRVNMDFEQSNANLAAILGTTTAGVERLTANAKRLGGETKFTASQITELQTVLARRGLSEDQILNMTHGITNLAIATGTDLAQSAELAASTMQAFGMQATEMDRIVSVLGVSTTKSALTTAALGTSLQYVAPASRAAGFSLEETVSILGTLVDNGINASTAGTSLRQILLSMSTSSGKLAKALGGPVKSFDELVAALRRLKNDGADSLESVSKAVRVTALPAFLALVNNADRLDELRESITGVDGELQKMADTQMSTAKGAKIVFQSAIEGLKLTFEESTGAMRNYYVWLTNIVNKWKEARALRNGGESAVNVFAWDDQTIQSKAQERIARERAYGRTDEQIANGARWASENTYGDGRIDKYLSFYRMLDGLGDYTDFKTKYKQQFDELGINTEGLIGDVLERMARTIANFRNNKAVEDYIYSKLGPKTVATTSGLGVDEESESDRIVSALDKIGKGKTPAEKAADIVASAQEAYAEALNKAAIEKEAGLLDEEKYSKRLLTAEESLMDAYSRAAAISGSDEYKTAFENEVKEVQKLAEATAALTKARKDSEEAEKEAKRAADEAAKELLKLDRSLLSSINSAVGSTGWNQIRRTDGGSLKVRFDSLKTQLLKGDEIPDDVWNTFVKDLNDKLESLKLPTIKLDFEANTVTKELTKLESFKNGMSDWQNGLGAIVSGVDALTSSIDTMKNAVEGNASAWDVMKSVINSTFTIMQSVVKVMETVNTLSEAHRALSDAEGASNLKEAATEGVKASASAAAAGAKGGESVAGIPVVGPVLAVAAVGAIAAAMAAMFKKTEYHAGGGFVGSPFVPRGTDTVPTMLTPGELVLNRAQQNNLAMQLAPAGRYGDLHMEKIITGEDIRIVLTNNARRRGGTGKNYAI